MSGLPRSWWGGRFIAALERFTDAGRLGRGRGYLRGGKIQNFRLAAGAVSATVEGSINPYYDVHETPYYQTKLALTPLPVKAWRPLLNELGSRAGPLAKLLLNELPDEVESLAAEFDLALLPAGPKDFSTACSCPDYVNPCKHVAGVCYRLAGMLDHDPLLLFELRGLNRSALRRSLLATPLGKALAETLDADGDAVEPDPSYYGAALPAAPAALSYQDYWQGGIKAPSAASESESGSGPGFEFESESRAGTEPATPVAGAVLKRGGDQPPFWPSEKSFIDAMDEFYERVRRHYKDVI